MIEFAKANETADLIFLPTNGAIKDWNDEHARRFVQTQMVVPVFTCDDFMMPYATFGLTKVAKEQGRWAAKAALEVIRGRSPHSIPVARNTQTVAFFNAGLAKKIGFRPAAHLLDRYRVVE